MNRNPREVPVPERMKHLPLDPRGYPEFFIGLRSPEGKHLFTVNDTTKQMQCVKQDLCEICGKKLLRGRWFIGGPLSAFHKEGVFSDAPMHDECAHYALTVCPYLAANRYGDAIAAKQLEQNGMEGLLTFDPSNPLLINRPPVFIAVMVVSQKVHPNHTGLSWVFKPGRPYRKVEFWQHGVRLPEDQGVAISAAYIEMHEQQGNVG